MRKNDLELFEGSLFKNVEFKQKELNEFSLEYDQDSLVINNSVEAPKSHVKIEMFSNKTPGVIQAFHEKWHYETKVPPPQRLIFDLEVLVDFSENFFHPHVEHGKILCVGSSYDNIRSLMSVGKFFQSALILRKILSTYNENSAFSELKIAAKKVCSICSIITTKSLCDLCRALTPDGGLPHQYETCYLCNKTIKKDYRFVRAAQKFACKRCHP